MTNKRSLFITVLVGLLLVASPAFAADYGGFPWSHWIAGMANLAIFLFIIIKFGGSHIQNFFATRRDTFLANMNAAQAAREEAEARLAELNAKLDNLEKERQSLLDEYHAHGEREKQRIVDAAKRQVEKMRTDAQATIDQEVKKAIALLEEQAVDLATELARKKAIAALDDKAQGQLVDRYLADLKTARPN